MWNQYESIDQLSFHHRAESRVKLLRETPHLAAVDDAPGLQSTPVKPPESANLAVNPTNPAPPPTAVESQTR